MLYRGYIVLFLSWLMNEKLIGQTDFEPVAVIELFSSQGCSSCPPADALLSKTIAKNNKKIIALSFHVDYWDRLGWKDPFSDKKFSERQQKYSEKMNLNSSYTPQMVLNGITEFIGSDEQKLSKSLDAALAKKAEVLFENIKLSYNGENKISLHYELKGNYKDCKINFALISLKEITFIKRGENSGLTQVNEHVARQFITKEVSQNGDLSFEELPSPASNNMAVVAYVQKKSTLEIIGAIQVKNRSLTIK